MAIVMAVITFAAVAPVAAQQLTANTNASQVNFPTGITVVGSASVTPSDLTNVYMVDREKQGITPDAFKAALAKLGIPGISVSFSGFYQSVTAPSTQDRAVRRVIARARWSIQSVEQKPDHPHQAMLRALALAVQDARKTADVIAAADNRKIGRLLNAEPMPLDYFPGVSAKLAEAAPFSTNAASGATVTARAIFTFELLP